ncbi:MAG: nuclease [Gemmatimonadetes bacterium]|nr:nuclease [Gemmatimonadota bacterium]
MPSLRTYRVFISHAWSYTEEYDRMVKLLQAVPNFSWSNYSVPKADPVDAKSATRLGQALKHQMGPAQIIVILAGMYVNHSDWVAFEMDYARECQKPVIGVYPWGSQRAPKAVDDLAAEMVGWNGSSVADAIRRHAL